VSFSSGDDIEHVAVRRDLVPVIGHDGREVPYLAFGRRLTPGVEPIWRDAHEFNADRLEGLVLLQVTTCRTQPPTLGLKLK